MAKTSSNEPIPTPTTLHEALFALQGDLESVKPNADNPHFKSKYADLHACWSHLKPLCQKYGLLVTQTPARTASGAIRVTTTVTHVPSGQSLSCKPSARPLKDDPQAIGSCITYLRRYGLALLGLITEGEDDDGNSASSPSSPGKVLARMDKHIAVGRTPKPQENGKLNEMQFKELLAFSSFLGTQVVKDAIKAVGKDRSADLTEAEGEAVLTALREKHANS